MRVYRHPEKKRAWKAAWQKKNPDKVAQYQRTYRAKHPGAEAATAKKAYLKRISKRPPVPQSCTCGTPRFKWLKGEWRCFSCIAIQTKRNRVALKLVQNRRITIKNRVQRWSRGYGTGIAKFYENLITNNPKIKATIPVKKVLALYFPKFTFCKAERIFDLNMICKLPIVNIGWICQCCGLYSDNLRFFDIDHKTPRCRGGHGRKENKQALCPNCHRQKTICDLGSTRPAQQDLLSTLFIIPRQQVESYAGSDRPPAMPETTADAGSEQKQAIDGVESKIRPRPPIVLQQPTP